MNLLQKCAQSWPKIVPQIAALDVLSSEPPQPDNPLLSAKNCIVTPHIAWATQAARTRLLGTVVENIGAFVAGDPQNVVN